MIGVGRLGRRLVRGALSRTGLLRPKRVPFRRHLSDDQADTLASQLGEAFDAPITAEKIQQICALFRKIEAKMIGRIAGDVDDHVLHYFMRLYSAQRIAEKPAAHAEIGTLFGGSLLLAMHAIEEAGVEDTAIAIDPLQGYYGHEKDIETGLEINRENLEHNIDICAPPTVRVKILQGFSQDKDILEQIRRWRLKSLWIDGDHSYEGIKSDWEAYTPLVIEGGYVLIDNYKDVKWPDITEYVDSELLANLHGWHVVCYVNRSILFQRAT